MLSWNIGVEGRRWTAEEVRVRAELIPPRIEVIDGLMLWSDEERMQLLAMLLENVGARAAVRLGSPEVWKQALDQRDPS
jgi:hypothetical protein